MSLIIEHQKLFKCSSGRDRFNNCLNRYYLHNNEVINFK